MRLVRGLLLLSVAAAALVSAPSAVPASVAGVPWPGTTIRVWDASGYTASVAAAIAAWNGVDADVRFVPAGTARGADVVVARLPASRAGVAGEATVGWVPGSRSRVSVEAGLSARGAAAVVAHELGHVLGLGHEATACSVMRPSVELGAEAAGDCGIGRCPRMVECLVPADDARALRRLYRVQRPTLVPGNVVAASSTTTGVAGYPITLRWRSPLDRPGIRVLVRAVRDSCPTTPYRGLSSVAAVPLERGQWQETSPLGLSRGTWCAGLWVQAPQTLYVGSPAYVRFTVR